MNELIDPIIEHLEGLSEMLRLKKLGKYPREVQANKEYNEKYLIQELILTLDYLEVDIDKFISDFKQEYKNHKQQ